MSRAVIIKNGDEPFPANVELVTREVPTPKEGELLVNIRIRPVNPSDVMALAGKDYPGLPLPGVAGYEGFGVVLNNNGNAKFSNGQRVIVMCNIPAGRGSWQEHVCVPEEDLLAVPEGMSDEVAAQAWLNPATLMGMLHAANAPEGAYLLQTAAASTLGRMLIQVAKHKGIKTINLVRRDEHVAELKELGGDVVINSRDFKAGELKKRIKAEIGDGVVWAALDAVCGPGVADLMACVRDGGKVLRYGTLGGHIAHVDVKETMLRGVTMQEFYFTLYLDSLEPSERARVIQEMLDLQVSGVMTPNIWKTMPLEEFVEAVNLTNQPGKPGKILLTTL